MQSRRFLRYAVIALEGLLLSVFCVIPGVAAHILYTVYGFETEFAFGFGRIGVARGDIAGTACCYDVRHFYAVDAFERIDYLEHRKAVAGPQIIDIHSGGESVLERGGMPGGEQGQPGEQGDGQTGGNQAPKAERKVDLDEALDKTIGTSPITLNQNNFRTRDGMQMVGTYYKGKGDKDTPVVIVLPDLESTRDSEPMTKLAVSLASEGYAVLIPDLRGRGESKSAMPNFPGMPNNDRNGQNAGASVNPNDVRMMISSDRELWFEFLIYVHNKGLCNVKKTIIVGSQFSAALASAWAKNDWTGKGDMYQNVIGLVLISPDAVDKKKKSRKRDDEEEAEPSEPTYDSLASLESVRSRAKGKGVFGYFVIVGAYNEEKKEAAQLIQRKIGGKADEEETNPANKTVMLLALETEKQGDVLYTYETFNLNKLVGQFVAKRVKELPTKRAKWEEIEAPRGR